MKKVLQLDGGGILGIIEISFLAELESKTNKLSHQLFDMIVGNSTGTLIGAMLSIGISATDILHIYKTNAYRIFKKRNQLWPRNWLRSKYDNENVKLVLKEIFNNVEYEMGDCLTKLMTTSINRDTSEAVFFKSWKEEHKNKPLMSVILRSIAAANYFGYYKDSEGEWLDGANGAHNCVLLYSLIELIKSRDILINKDTDDKTIIVSLGCGSSPYSKKITHIPYIDDIINTSVIARKQSVTDQVYLLETICNNGVNIIFNRFNPDVTYEIDDLSKIDECDKIGKELFKNFNYGQLL